ncbi:cytochrome b/b6 domain-containing protein [Guyparkeria hydrothermalis]|uniref:cytochrome b/b6 domain-containing protein n=1 Tax=Guyparkeria hydrothermalis TaxID=923 RepID=UPI00201FD2B7|nr:cytochrome b/b6 domain-containing protein [Guyparkeria hydrothermalis]MCL7744932.1 cytochrome b/b6 domain-containing protein [Guyparkeria hydrothermalis]
MTTDNPITVWDRFVRLFHWLLVAAFFTAYLVEDDWLGVHVWAGYLVFSLVVLRLAWGFVGSRHARFTDFVRRPVEVLGYLTSALAGRARRYLGHNPTGGAMVIALIGSLLSTAVLGMLLLGSEPGNALYGFVGGLGLDGEAGEEALEETHEFFANFTLALVGLHVAGVLFSSLAHRENLVRAMITGRKRPNRPEEEQA